MVDPDVQDWERLRKAIPAIEIPAPSIDEQMKAYVLMAEEECGKEMRESEWFKQHEERKKLEEFNERWGNVDAGDVYTFDDDKEDVVNSPSHYNNGTKHDEHKPRMHLIPPKALLEVGMVLTEGAKKYGDHNWKQLDSLQERYTSAALRHMMAHMAGETYDDETNLSHLAHAICCLMFKLEIEIEEAGE